MKAFVVAFLAAAGLVATSQDSHAQYVTRGGYYYPSTSYYYPSNSYYYPSTPYYSTYPTYPSTGNAVVDSAVTTASYYLGGNSYSNYSPMATYPGYGNGTYYTSPSYYYSSPSYYPAYSGRRGWRR